MAKKQRPQYVIYSRKSRFTGKGESIENQIELCRRYIAVHHGQQMAQQAIIYEDEGFSGGDLERPQFKKMMQSARAKHFTAIVVYRLDRISRNIGDFAKLIDELNGLGIDFISIKEQFDTQSPMGRAMMYISSVFSQLERETIAERIRDNMHELAKTGRWLGGNTPTGYESESISRLTIDGKKRKVCRLKMIPDEIRLVRLIYEKYAQLGSLSRVEEFLLAHRYETKNGNDFTRLGIRNILTNPVYMIADKEALDYLKGSGVELFGDETAFDAVHGIMAYNRSVQQSGRANQIRPMEEWIVAVGDHEGIIAGADWVKVQQMLERGRNRSYRKTRSNMALLSGLLYCGNCGSYMRPKLTNRKQEDGSLTYPYICTCKEHSRGTRCKMKNINGNLLDRLIMEELGKSAYDKGEFVRRLESSRNCMAGVCAAQMEIEQLQVKVKENEQEIRKQVELLPRVAGTVAASYVMKKIEALHAAGERMCAQLNELERLRIYNELDQEGCRHLIHTLSDFGTTVDLLDVEQKRLVVRAAVQKVVWDGERVHLWFSEA